MIDQKKIDRINELSRLARERELTLYEKEERAVLRSEYVSAVRMSLTGQLDNTVVLRPDGSREKLRRDEKRKK